jgi:hypothetical protein
MANPQASWSAVALPRRSLRELRRGGYGATALASRMTWLALGSAMTGLPSRSSPCEVWRAKAGWEAGIRAHSQRAEGELRCAREPGRPATSEALSSEWLGVRDDFRNWLQLGPEAREKA